MSTFYDAEESMRRIVATRFPDVEVFARDRFVNPRRPDEVVALWERTAEERAAAAGDSNRPTERRRGD